MTKRRGKQERRPHDPDTPVNWSRLRQVFGNLTNRRQPVLQDLVPSGIIVDAETPAELVEKTDEVLVERTRKEPEN